LFAPYKIGAITLTLNCVLMIFLVGLMNINPLYCVFLAVGCHIGLIALGEKEPHLTNVMRAWAYGKMRTKNIVRSKGNKFVP
jgi:hypothetical protein